MLGRTCFFIYCLKKRMFSNVSTLPLWADILVCTIYCNLQILSFSFSFKHICLAAVVIGLPLHCNDKQNKKWQDMVHFSSSEDKQKAKVIEPTRQAAQEACLLYFLLLCWAFICVEFFRWTIQLNEVSMSALQQGWHHSDCMEATSKKRKKTQIPQTVARLPCWVIVWGLVWKLANHHWPNQRHCCWLSGHMKRGDGGRWASTVGYFSSLAAWADVNVLQCVSRLYLTFHITWLSKGNVFKVLFCVS